jgi:hypothetical protein
MPDPTILEIAVRSKLEAIDGTTKAYALFVPQNTLAPFDVYQRIGAERDFTLQGPSGLADVRMQIDTYAIGYIEARTRAGLIRQAFDGFRGVVSGVDILACRLDSDFDLFEEGTDPKLFRVSADYLISHREI